jgi:hypothetical protein
MNFSSAEKFTASYIFSPSHPPSFHYANDRHGAANSSVGITTGYGQNGRGFDSRQGQENFLYSAACRSALRLTQLPIQWVPGVKRPGREADHSRPSSAVVRNGGAIPRFHLIPSGIGLN